MRILILVTLLLLIGCDSFQEEATTEPTTSSDTRGNLFRQVVGEARERFEIPALAAGYWRTGQEPVIVLLGNQSLDSDGVLTENTRFRIGSVTKAFTVTVILQLAEEGRLDLQDPISDYVQDIHNGDATLEELANMTSGIFNYTGDQAFILDFIQNLATERSDQELIAVANRNDPNFSPGTSWRYSNTNTVLLGRVVEIVTGSSLADEIETRILQPLGMSQSLYPLGLGIPSPFATGYANLEDDGSLSDVTATHPSASSGSGAMISTLADLRVFAEALAQGTLLQPETQLRRLQLIDTLAEPTSPEYDEYGAGIGTLDGWLGHTGDYIGYQALIMSEPSTGETVVILINLKNFELDHLPTDMFREFVQGASSI